MLVKMYEGDSGSKKNPAAVALHFMHYNFARIRKSLRVAAAMGLAWRITSGRWRR